MICRYCEKTITCIDTPIIHNGKPYCCNECLRRASPYFKEDGDTHKED